MRALLASSVLGALLLATVPAGPAGAQESDDPDATGTGEEEPAEQVEPARIELVDQTPWVRPGEQMRLWFRIDQPGAAAVQLIIHDALGKRGDFVDTLEGELGGTAAPPQPRSLDEITRSSDGTYEMAIPIGGPAGISLPGHGVYPVELLVTDAAGTEELTSLVTYLLLLPENPDTFPPLNVAVVMEMGGPPGLEPDGTIEPDNATASHLNSRIGALDQAPEVPLTVAPVPETLDALAGWGEPGRAVLERLRRAVGNREVLGRPYVDLDLDALAAAGLQAQAGPEAMAGAQVLRERLREPLEQTWLTGATVGDAEVNALRDLGIGRVVVPESAVEELDQNEGPVPVGPVQLVGDGPRAAVSDDALAGRLLEGNGALGTQRFLAELTMIWLTRPSISDRAVVVRIPEDAPVEPTVLGKALLALDSGGAARAIGLDEYFTLPPVGGEEEPIVVDRTGDGAPVDLRSLTRPLENAQRTVTGLAGTLDDRARIQSLHRSLLISLETELTMAQRRAYIDRVGDVVASVSDGVNAPPGFTITLTARTGTIPLTIENRTDQTVSVDVLLQSNQLEFPDGDQLTNVSVPPGGRRLDLSVRTRTSGAMPLHITLTSPDRNVVYDRTTFTIRSTAVSGVGLVLSLGAGAFLLLWWGRHWRTARRSRRLVGSGNGNGGADDPGGPRGPGTPSPPPQPESPMAALAALSSTSPSPPPPAPPVPSIPPMLPPPPRPPQPPPQSFRPPQPPTRPGRPGAPPPPG